MPVLVVDDFDTPAVSNMNEAVSPIVNQLLQVRLQTEGRKLVTDIQCGYVGQSLVVPADAMNAISRTNIVGRVAILTGRINLDGQPINSLLQAFNPITTIIDRSIIPYSRAVFDQQFVNTGNFSFSIPKEIPEGEDVNVFLSQGLIFGDAILVSATKIGYLNVGGYYGEAVSPKVPFRMR